MPQQRDERGRFIKNDLTIQLPAPLSLLKYLIISIILYPWYYIIVRIGILDKLSKYIFPVRQIVESMTPEERNSTFQDLRKIMPPYQ